MRFRLIAPAAGVLSVLLTTQAFGAPVVVACGRGQHAVIRESYSRGEPVTRVHCVYNGAYREVPYRTRYVPRHHHRSWGKTALVIGGSTAAGAGLGGIVGGGKGAAIGAAIGGGASTLFEALGR